MPLVVVVGHPSSGKTFRSLELFEFLTKKQTGQAEEKKKEEKLENGEAPVVYSSSLVEVLNHESLHIPRSMYIDSSSEKKGRAAFRSAVERLLNRQRIVILDFLNNIKGFRYELFTRSKAGATQHCVYFIDSSPEDCRSFNEGRPEGEKYSNELLQDLMGRMEAPNEEKRWDQPLFTVKPGEEAPLEAIAQFLLHGKQLSQGLATLPSKGENSQYLFQLDQITQAIVQKILQAQASGLHTQGEEIVVSSACSEKFLLARAKFHLPELRRIQQQFIKLAKLRPVQGEKQIAQAFIQHLNITMKTE